MKPTESIACSLVITTYNSPETLDLVLRSALLQSDPPCEIIIADDGSNNDTARMVETYRAAASIPVVHVWQEDLGFRAATSRNKAIASAKGNYVVIVDGDMLLNHNFIKEVPQDYHHQLYPSRNHLSPAIRLLPDR